MKTYKSQPRGFVALMSVVIISAILLIYVFGLGATSFFARLDSLDAENKRESLALAEACVHAALLKITQDVNYTPAASGDSISISGKSCKICPGTNSPVGASPKPIYTRALYNSSYTNLSVAVSVSGGVYTVTGWSEGAAGNPACTLP